MNVFQSDGSVALSHDYLTQRGGAERVALELCRLFPRAPLFTTLYEPANTYTEFRNYQVVASSMNSSRFLRTHHRYALPVLRRAVGQTFIDSDLLIASSSGWAHGFPCSGNKLVYCHAPARWLYKPREYLNRQSTHGMAKLRLHATVAALHAVTTPLRRWDARAAHTAVRYLANSTAIRDAIWDAYGIDAEVVHPPAGLGPGKQTEVAGIDPGFYLCVARLLPYKNVDSVIQACGSREKASLVIVGDGPELERLKSLACGQDVTFVANCSDDQLRWLYANSRALVSASFEDFGLAPLEAGSFGKPAVVLRAGGFLDTVDEGLSGVFFDVPRPSDIARALDQFECRDWDADAVVAHAAQFSSSRFQERILQVVRSL